jgi:parallel beta helix pectate lyase-like protein
MSIRSLVCTLVGGLALLAASSAHAQATRTWVSGVGDDANPCSRTAPCKTFAGAISKTAAGGEIDALDPGGFGSVTITKSITIDGRNTNASILASGVQGVVINAGANDVVTLRGLSINGAGVTLGTNGIKYFAGATVHVEDCYIFGFSGSAIDFQPPAGVNASLFVKRATISNIGTNGILAGGAGNASVVVTRSHVFNAATGIHANGAAHVNVHDTVLSGNAGYGLRAEGTAEVNMDRGLVSGNGVGVQGDSLVRLSDVMVGHNTTGVAGMVTSFGNNRVAAGNGSNGAPTTTVQQQ